MSDIQWTDVKPGEDGVKVRPDQTDPAALIITDGVPDWVRYPAELGGGQVRVLRAFRGQCACGTHMTRILILDEPTGIRVATCPINGFMWFRRK